MAKYSETSDMYEKNITLRVILYGIEVKAQNLYKTVVP